MKLYFKVRSFKTVAIKSQTDLQHKQLLLEMNHLFHPVLLFPQTHNDLKTDLVSLIHFTHLVSELTDCYLLHWSSPRLLNCPIMSCDNVLTVGVEFHQNHTPEPNILISNTTPNCDCHEHS